MALPEETHQLEDAKAFLLQSDATGNNLYNHLSGLILHLLEHRPTNALKNIENISLELKQHRLEVKHPSPQEVAEQKKKKETQLNFR
jgi:hypothetical protein